jgi:ATP-dependent Clp protease ATP-binding subunit ClpC
MFERYTEKARRVIFFARYEASQFGSSYIETEHLLLGLLREDKALTNRFIGSHNVVESIRKQVQVHSPQREKVSTSVDLPLSNESKRVLAYAAEEAERFGHKHIGPEHLLLALLREERCFAAEMLKGREIKQQKIRDELARHPHQPVETRAAGAPAQSGAYDLTQAALEGQLEPVIGRDVEINAVIQVLSRLHNPNPLLVGEPGSGKTAIVEAVAQRIADGSAPQLTGKRVAVLDLRHASSQLPGRAAPTIDVDSDLIVFAGDLRSVLAWVGLDHQRPIAILRRFPFQDPVHCIATSTPGDYEECLRAAPWLRNVFRPVFISPFDRHQALKVLEARKARYEAFHEVSYSDEALQCAVDSASGYLPDQVLPGKALELLDAAAVRLKLNEPALPQEALEVAKRIRFIVYRMDSAIANHEFEKAKFYSDEEKKEREALRLLREKYQLGDTSRALVQPEDVEAVIESWSEYPFKPRQTRLPATPGLDGPEESK